MVEECEERGFVDRDATGAEAAIRERLSGEFCWAFVFLPDAHFRGEAKLFAEAALFERRANEKRLASARKNEREEPFAGPPADAGEVVKRRAGGDEERVELGRKIRHELLGVREPSAKLLVGDRNDA